jgi:hypothetical protein
MHLWVYVIKYKAASTLSSLKVAGIQKMQTYFESQYVHKETNPLGSASEVSPKFL